MRQKAVDDAVQNALYAAVAENVVMEFEVGQYQALVD